MAPAGRGTGGRAAQDPGHAGALATDIGIDDCCNGALVRRYIRPRSRNVSRGQKNQMVERDDGPKGVVDTVHSGQGPERIMFHVRPLPQAATPSLDRPC